MTSFLVVLRIRLLQSEQPFADHNTQEEHKELTDWSPNRWWQQRQREVNIKSVQKQRHLERTGLYVRGYAVVQITKDVTEEGFVTFWLRRVHHDGGIQLLVVRGIGQGMVRSGRNNDMGSGAVQALLAIERGAEVPDVNAKGFGLVLVPMVGRLVYERSGFGDGAHDGRADGEIAVVVVEGG